MEWPVTARGLPPGRSRALARPGRRSAQACLGCSWDSAYRQNRGSELRRFITRGHADRRRCQITADCQKRRFKADPANEGKFISTGLWCKSRHPNYLGENVLWIGVLLIAVPVLAGWQWVALLSPVFVALLPVKGRGIPPLEKKADKKWHGRPDYEAYKKNTPVLVPAAAGLT